MQVLLSPGSVGHEVIVHVQKKHRFLAHTEYDALLLQQRGKCWLSHVGKLSCKLISGKSPFDALTLSYGSPLFFLTSSIFFLTLVTLTNYMDYVLHAQQLKAKLLGAVPRRIKDCHYITVFMYILKWNLFVLFPLNSYIWIHQIHAHMWEWEYKNTTHIFV